MTTQQPRIYTYKVTFMNAPFWYWGVHKEERYGEVYFGSPKTHKWVWDFYEPEIQILELFPCTDEGWEEACRVEKRLIRPDLNKAGCLNENVGGVMSLEVLRKVAASLHAEKDEDGKSVAGKKRAAATNAKLTKEEKSEFGKKGAAVLNTEKDEDGKSVNAKKAGAAAKLVHQKKVEITRVSDKVTFVFEACRDACRDLDLDLGSLSKVCNGKRKTHMGYTARYLG